MRTTRLLIFIYYADSPNGLGMQQDLTDTRGGAVSQWVGAFTTEITPDTIRVQTGGKGVSLSTVGIKLRGYLRIVAIGLP